MSGPVNGHPLAYLITWLCYGTWLHGYQRDSVDDEHNIPGDPYLPPDPKKVAAELSKMDQPPYSMDEPQREILLLAIRQTCEYRGMDSPCCTFRENHVHVVVTADATPERVMNDLKAYCSRRLNEAGFDTQYQKCWTRHGSTRYLWSEDSLLATIDYTLNRQGEPMSRWRKD